MSFVVEYLLFLFPLNIVIVGAAKQKHMKPVNTYVDLSQIFKGEKFNIQSVKCFVTELSELVKFILIKAAVNLMHLLLLQF